MNAKCDIYYKNPLSDIYHPWKSETTIADYIAETTAEDVGERELLFMFWNFKFPAGGYVTASYPTFDTECYMQIYSRANIPEEDFNTGLTAYGDVSQSGTGSITVRVDAVEDVPAVNCLFISNQFALNWLTTVTPLTVFTVQKIAQLYSRENGEKVFPLIKINNTLTYDSNGILGASDDIVNGVTIAVENRAELIGIVDNGFKNVLDLNAATNVITRPEITYTFVDGILTITWENLTEGKTLKFKNIPHIDGTYILTGVQTLTDPTLFRADIRQGADAADIITMDYGQTNPDPFTFQSGVFDYVIRIAPESAETPTSGTATIKPMICSVPDYNISPLFAEYKEKITLLQLTQAEYDLIVDPDPHTLYIIVG